MRPRLVITLAVFMAVMGAGCELQANLKLELRADGSGNVVAQIALDDEFLELIRSSGQDPEEAFFGAGSSFFGDIPEAQQRVYTEGDFTYFEAGAPFDDIAAAQDAFADQTDNLLEDVEIRVDENDAVVRGSVSLAVLGDLGAAGLEGFNPEAFSEFFSFHIQIAMPGDVRRHNADRVLEDGTLEWDVPLFGGADTLTIEAESDPSGGGGFPTWAWILIIVAAVAVVIVGATLVRGRTPSYAAETPGPMGEGDGAGEDAAGGAGLPEAAPEATAGEPLEGPEHTNASTEDTREGPPG